MHITSAEVTLAADQGLSSGEVAKLFSNGAAQLPISVYVDPGDAKIEFIGLAEATVVTDPYYPDGTVPDTYPMPEQLSAKKVDSVNDYDFKSHPDNTVLPRLDANLYPKRQIFMVKTKKDMYTVGETVRVELMAYVRLSNYSNGGDEKEEVVLFSSMSSSTVNVNVDTRVNVELVGKPPLDLTRDSVPFDADRLDRGEIYLVSAKYEGGGTADLKSTEWEIRTKNGSIPGPAPMHDLKTNSSEIQEFGFEGLTSGINAIARAIGHGAASFPEITQVTNNGTTMYTCTKGSAIASFSGFYFKSSHIYDACCNQPTIEHYYIIRAIDWYGEKVELKVSVDCNAHNNGKVTFSFKINRPK